MYGTTTVNNLEILGNITYQGNMLTFCGQSTTSPCITSSNVPIIPYGDWLIVMALILFMVAFIPVTSLFGLLKKR